MGFVINLLSYRQLSFMVFALCLIFTITGCNETVHQVFPETGRYQLGDHADWSAESFDDSSWPIVPLPGALPLPKTSQAQKYWIRIHLKNCPQDLSDPAIILGKIGDTDEVYFNGKFIGRTGRIDDDSHGAYHRLRVYRIPKEFLVNTKDVVLAVRGKKHFVLHGGIYSGPLGLGEFDELKRKENIDYFFVSELGLLLGFFSFMMGLYHLYLFIRLPQKRMNLWYFAFSVVSSLFILSLGWKFMEWIVNPRTVLLLHAYLGILSAPLLLVFFNAALHRKLSRGERGLIGLNLIFLPAVTLFPGYQEVFLGFNLWYPIGIGTIIYVGIATVRSVRQGRKDLIALAIASGVLLITALVDVFIGFGLWTAFQVSAIGFFALNVGIMISLAHDFTGAYLNIEEKVEARTQDLQIANEQLRSLEKMKERVFANISHDFKTPITVALGALDQLKQVAGEAGASMVSSGRRNLEGLLGMIGDLLDTVKSESGTLKMTWESAPIAQIVADWSQPCQFLCKQKGIEFRQVTQGLDALKVPIDVKKFHRVFDNLLSNAVKFTDRRKASDRSNRNPAIIEVRLRVDESRVYLEVSDSGIGVPPEEHEKIFERFYQSSRTLLREFGGSGIGLSFAKEMVDLHNGRIAVDESPFGGSRFTVSLPLSQDVEITGEYQLTGGEPSRELRGSLDVAYPRARPEMIDPEKPTVLLVEDNPEVAQVIARVLEERFNLYFAPNGKDALKALETTRVDCIVSDIQMPQMSGTELLKELRSDARYQGVPVIMLTSLSEEEDVIAHLQMGAQDYVAKPFRKEILLTRVSVQTEALRLREHLLHSERLVAVGTLTAGICHEIRNPLNNIGAVTLRMSGELTPEKTTEYADTISRNVDRADRIVKDLLSFSRKDEGVKAPVNLREMITRTKEYLGAETLKGVKISIDLPEGLLVQAYPNELQQVFLNILLNAVQAIPGEGSIHIHSVRDQEAIKVLVTDTGVGMPAEVQKQIFTPFFTTKDQGKGTGLGLYLAYSIMLRHNGFIHVSGAPGKGTTVTLGFKLSHSKGEVSDVATL